MAIKLEVQPQWQCQASGDCCRLPARVTMTFAERRELEAAARRGLASRPLQFRHHAESTMTDMVAKPCPFVTADNRCNAYEVRPYNCRRFACLRPDVAAEPFDERMLPMRLQALPLAREMYATIQRDAQPWARDHGWKE